MRCIVHIGSAKTATSSLQAVLFQNRQYLAARGWLYPTTGLWHADRSHNAIGIHFWDNFFDHLKKVPFEDLLDQLIYEIKGWKNVIISSELIEKAAIRGNQNVHLFLSRLAECGFDIQVIYVIRRQDHFLDSQFKQEVGDFNAAFKGSVNNFIKSHSSTLAYSAIASAWNARSEVSGVAVIPFQEGRVSETFVEILRSMGQHDLVATGMKVPMLNPSLDGDYLRLKHFLNRFDLPQKLHKSYAESFTLKLDKRLRPAKLTLFSEEERRALLHGFQADHAELAAKYGVDAIRWSGDDAKERQVFKALTPPEAREVLAEIRTFNRPLAEEILAYIDEKLPPAASSAVQQTLPQS